jgi:hypothetical protein
MLLWPFFQPGVFQLEAGDGHDALLVVVSPLLEYLPALAVAVEDETSQCLTGDFTSSVDQLVTRRRPPPAQVDAWFHSVPVDHPPSSEYSAVTSPPDLPPLLPDEAEEALPPLPPLPLLLPLLLPRSWSCVSPDDASFQPTGPHFGSLGESHFGAGGFQSYSH